MIVSVGFLPSAPLVVDEVAAGAAPELDGLRAECDRVLTDALAGSIDVVALVAPGGRTRWLPEDATGSLRGFGVDVRVGLGAPGGPATSTEDSPDVLEYGQVVGAWLLDRKDYRGVRRALTVAPGDGETAALLLSGLDARCAVVVMGDASARLSVKAPGYFDAGAQEFDAAVLRSLAAGDAAALAKLDRDAAVSQLASGYDGWHAVALALISQGHVEWDARCHYEAPYGVGYLAAVWT